ncbi:MAG: HAD family phosphatase [Bacilli bacterium]|nr:HAD family phosphatase [Bacilli bacterium]
MVFSNQLDIRMVAMDLDGTLLDSRTKLTNRTIKAIESLKRKGIYIVIASGRTDKEILVLLKDLKLEDYDKAYIIAYNGVLTIKAGSIHPLNRQMMNKEDILSIQALVKPRKLALHVFSEDVVYLSQGIPESSLLTFERQMQHESVHMDCFNIDKPIYKVLIHDESRVLDDLRNSIPEHYHNKYNIFKSAPLLLEFVHKLGSKGIALKALRVSLSIEKDHVLAFGDEENDISLLEEAGIAIAMGNGIEKIKQKANLIAPSNDLNGVQVMIDQLIK